MLEDDTPTDEDAIQLLNNNAINNARYNTNEGKAEHDRVLSYSKKIGLCWIGIGFFQWFFFCCRWYVWILYARSLGEHNISFLAFGVYSVYFIQAFGNLFWGWIGDQYSYDIIGLLLSFFIVIGLFIESVAMNYWLLLIGTLIVDVFRVHNTLAMAFLAKYLPNYYALKYLSLRFALIGSANLLGPVLGGVLVTHFGLKAPFYLSTIIAFLTFLFMLIYVNGTQKKLHSQQSQFKHLYDILSETVNESEDLSNVIYQFPISTDEFIQRKKRENIVSVGIRAKCKNGIPTLTQYEWFMLINILVSNACVVSIEGAGATYFVVFALDLFNTSVIESTVMVTSMSLTFIIGTVLTTPIIQRYKNADNFIVEFISLMIGNLFMVLFNVFSRQCFNVFGSYWLWVTCAVSGFALGSLNMLQEIVLLTLQPKHHSGKISGAKQFVRNVARAFITLLIGILWSVDIYFFLYMQAVFYLIAFIAVSSMMIAYYLHK